MKKMKLFPKTFLYVFFLMAIIALISHALFFFLMPLVYTAQEEEAFKDAEKQLCFLCLADWTAHPTAKCYFRGKILRKKGLHGIAKTMYRLSSKDII